MPEVFALISSGVLFVSLQTGRRLVFRSEPPPIKEKEDENQGLIDKEKEEALYYFT